MVAKIAELDMIKPADNPGSMTDICYTGEPFVKDIGGLYFVSHDDTVAHKRQFANAWGQHDENDGFVGSTLRADCRPRNPSVAAVSRQEDSCVMP